MREIILISPRREMKVTVILLIEKGNNSIEKTQILQGIYSPSTSEIYSGFLVSKVRDRSLVFDVFERN